MFVVAVSLMGCDVASFIVAYGMALSELLESVFQGKSNKTWSAILY